MKATGLATLAGLGLAQAAVVFEDDFKHHKQWVSSTWKDSAEMADMEITTPKNYPDDSDDTALSTTIDARFYATSAEFKSAAPMKDKHLMVQYEVTYDTDIDCGGAYLKIGPKMEDQTKFGDPTEYALMFGPDKCGHTSRTHLIFNYNGKNVLKKTDLPYKQDKEGISTLYRMVLSPQNKVTVKIDDEEVYSGDMEEDWGLLEPKEIDDPDDKKPDDWVDDAMMDDPDDEKPVEWVEEKEIIDAEAKQPEDWDEEEDGTWEAPMIPNPDYKGEWSAKRINNPAYKGVWSPKRIANPKYSEDKDLYLMNKKDLAFVGFDLWQVKAGTRIDNLVIATGDSVEEATKEGDIKTSAWKDLVAKMTEKKAATETTTTTPDSAPEMDEDDDSDSPASKDDEEDL